MTPVPNPVSPRTPKKKQLQTGALFGIALAFGGVYWSLMLQGGAASDLWQWSSLVLLLAGTAGALLITTPMDLMREALAAALRMFSTRNLDARSAVSLITALTRKAKKAGVIALEEDLPNIHVPLVSQAIRMAADGSTAAEVTAMMRLQVRIASRRMDRQARVFEAAGGYAPTLGILGAVLGLIQVMKHLDEMTAVGHGIAAAFVSTVYGLALANLVLLPIAGRLRASGAQWLETQELLTEGVICLMEQVHPMMVESRLAPFLVNPASQPEPSRRDLRQVAIAKGA